MSKVNLKQVLESLLKEDQETASTVIHEWFIDIARKVHGEIVEQGSVQETDELSNVEDISDVSEDDESAEAHQSAGKWMTEEEIELFIPEDLIDLWREVGDRSFSETNLVALANEFFEENNIDIEIAQARQSEDDESEFEWLVVKLPSDNDSESGGVDDDSFKDFSDFEDLEESFKGLEKVSVNADKEGSTVGDGEKISVNTKPALDPKNTKVEPQGKPVEMKSTEHKGYDLEPAPKVEKNTRAKNTLDSASKALKPVKAKNM